MKFIAHNSMLIFAALLLHACTSSPDLSGEEVLRISNAGIEATSPYFTTDASGNPVLCWSEMDPKDSLYRLTYARYRAETHSFSHPVIIAGSEGLSTAPESMGKIAFKSDGTIVAVFAKAFKNEKNPFAGAIYYSLSTDSGKNWTTIRYLHSDTTRNTGRSFFDLTRLKNGEVAAVWLDGRYKDEIEGSALFFASTVKGTGFNADTCLDKGTCECCRTDLLTDEGGNIHIAYRSILYPDGPLGKQVRDMVYKVSADQGHRFSAARPISSDHWAIEGCPHTGPSLAIQDKAVNAVWFTGGGTTGLYYTRSKDRDAAFQKRQLLSPAGRHPQMIALPGGKLIMACEEMEAATEDHHAMDHQHSGESMAKHHGSAGMSKIVLYELDNGIVSKRIGLSDGMQADHHAVLANTEQGLLVAWVREEQGHASVCYSRLPKP